MDDELRIMVAVDFNQFSDDAYDVALKLAQRMCAQLVIVHIVSPSSALSGAEMAEEDRAEDGTRFVGLLMERATQAGVRCEGYVETDRPVAGILRAIKQFSPSIVVVGSHGRGGVTRALLGSVSDALCRVSPVAVMVVPHAKRRILVEKNAFSCALCGHIAAHGDAPKHCAHCGTKWVEWDTAEISRTPARAAEPTQEPIRPAHTAPQSLR